MAETTLSNKFFTYEVDSDGIAVITIDQKDNPTNLFSYGFIEEYLSTAHKAIADDKIKGVILTSGRRMFMAGADLRELEKQSGSAEDQVESMMKMHQGMRAIETGGKPFVAAINGVALGGGLELCMACHHRICLDNPKIKIGFPEVQVGLLPGGGGTAKAPYLMGLQTALMYMLQGIQANPQKAHKDGLIDALASSQDEMITAAKEWIVNNPTPMQPWDNKKHKIPGGGLMTPNGVQTMMGAIGNVRKMTHGNYPAAQAIMSVVHDGIQVKIDRALEIEARYFTQVQNTKEAKNLIRTGFLGVQAAKKGIAKPQGVGDYEIKKLGVLGAGMMGAGIAYVSAFLAKQEVVLKDVTLEGAEKGKDYSRALLKKRVSRGKMTQEQADEVLARIKTTADPKDVKGCDMVIEAVFENVDLKAKVTAETEVVLAKDKIYASNTSTIPITLLAEASDRPENFIGIHFFSPVDKMPLVEIIVGEKTNDKAIGAAIDYTMAIKKVPIVVNDSRGFYTSRCFGTYTSEGAYLLEEGVLPVVIENIAKTKGMPVGPLAVTDEVSLTLGLHVMESDPRLKDNAELQRNYNLTKKMVEELGRGGKKAGAGFYEYPEGGKKFLWPELKTIFKSKMDVMPNEVVAKRLLHRQAMEAYRCLDEGVLRSVVDGDIGSLMGWGFPPYTGGALSYIDYVGMDTFIAECDDFTKKFGDRFTVPDSLRAMAKAGKSIHDFGKSDLSVADVKKLKEVELVALANKMGISATVDDLKADTLKKVLAKMEA
jgi:3-hydroxyacyl-CoA dehydrogenase/enoyl-CoA hydratase/3-hydroxybutyryl-CoA epimerase